MRAAGAPDVLIVSLGSTAGLRAADEELQDSLRRAGASVAIAPALAPGPARTLMLTDLGWARAARAAARATLRRLGEKWKHVDNHAMWIDPKNSDIIWLGTGENEAQRAIETNMSLGW